MELANAKHWSLWKPNLSWFFCCSDIPNIVYLNFLRNRLVIWGHDWKICAISPSVGSLPHSRNVSKLLIEHITLVNRVLREQLAFTTIWWLFCKYPSAASHSKVLKRLSSAWIVISNDLHKIIIWPLKIGIWCWKYWDKFLLVKIDKHRLGSYTRYQS